MYSNTTIPHHWD